MGRSHDVYVAMAPVGISCQASHVVALEGSQLDGTHDHSSQYCKGEWVGRKLPAQLLS